MTEQNKPSGPASNGVPSLGKATPDTAGVRWQRRKRQLLQGVVVTFVLISAWIGVLVAMQVASSSGYNFRAETQHILEQMRNGKFEEVYQAASPRLHQAMIADRFLELASDINQTLGAFRQLLAIKLVESISGPGGDTRRVRATIEFDNGKTSASFSYHWHDQRWKLLQLGIDLPPDLARAVISRSETRAARKEAPKEIYDLAERILEFDRDGKIEKIWRDSSATFQQSIDRETFLKIQAERKRVLGRYLRILDTLKSSRNSSRTQASITWIVQYEKAKAKVSLSFIKMTDVWKLTYYKVVIPPLRFEPLSAEPPPP